MADSLPEPMLDALISHLFKRNPQTVLETIGPLLNRNPNLDNMPIDLPVENDLQFEHLAGLFASNSLNHAVISMTIRQTAYIFGFIRQMNARKVIEIGRYKGGSTLLMAAAVGKQGEVWSIDCGEKEERLRGKTSARTYDEQLAALSERFGLKIHIIVGNSKIVEVQTGEVDLVLIDGCHSYEGVKNDFERFGTRVRQGGSLLFDDAFDETLSQTHSETVGRLVGEILTRGDFKLIKIVNRMAHLERVK